MGCQVATFFWGPFFGLSWNMEGLVFPNRRGSVKILRGEANYPWASTTIKIMVFHPFRWFCLTLRVQRSWWYLWKTPICLSNGGLVHPRVYISWNFRVFSYQLLPSNLLITQVTGSSQGIPGYQGTPKMPYSNALPETWSSRSATTTSFGSRSEAEAEGTTWGEGRGDATVVKLSTFSGWAPKNATRLETPGNIKVNHMVP